MLQNDDNQFHFESLTQTNPVTTGFYVRKNDGSSKEEPPSLLTWEIVKYNRTLVDKKAHRGL